MYPLYFSAALKSADGKTLEIGEACLAGNGGALDFNGEFVPLMNLGERAEIVRLLGEHELERFPGRVWRCTKKSLRLTGVPAEALQTAERLFAVNAHIPAVLLLSPDGTFEFAAEKAARLDANIRYLSLEQIRLTSMRSVPEETAVLLDAAQARLHGLALRVTQRVALGRNANLLVCAVTAPQGENRRTLEQFAAAQAPQIRIL